MDIVCINNRVLNLMKPFDNITIGKSYQVLYTYVDSYYLVSDYGEKLIYPKYLFITLEEYRNNKLNNILSNAK